MLMMLGLLCLMICGNVLIWLLGQCILDMGYYVLGLVRLWFCIVLMVLVSCRLLLVVCGMVSVVCRLGVGNCVVCWVMFCGQFLVVRIMFLVVCMVMLFLVVVSIVLWICLLDCSNCVVGVLVMNLILVLWVVSISWVISVLLLCNCMLCLCCSRFYRCWVNWCVICMKVGIECVIVMKVCRFGLD